MGQCIRDSPQVIWSAIFFTCYTEHVEFTGCFIVKKVIRKWKRVPYFTENNHYGSNSGHFLLEMATVDQKKVTRSQRLLI